MPLSLFGGSGNYASALFLAASKANTLDKVESEILDLVEASKRSPLFSQFIEDLSVPRETRVRAVQQIFSDVGFSDVTKNFLGINSFPWKLFLNILYYKDIYVGHDNSTRFYLEVNCFNTGVKACHSEILFYVHDIVLYYKDIMLDLTIQLVMILFYVCHSEICIPSTFESFIFRSYLV